MAHIQSYKELRVYQAAMQAAMRIFELTKYFPVEERYSHTDQIRKASRSVLLEHWGGLAETALSGRLYKQAE